MKKFLDSWMFGATLVITLLLSIMGFILLITSAAKRISNDSDVMADAFIEIGLILIMAVSLFGLISPTNFKNGIINFAENLKRFPSKFKKIIPIIILLALALMPAMVNAAEDVEYQNGKFLTRITLGGNITGKFDYYGFALANNKGYGQVYFGIIKKLGPFGIGIGAGFQTVKNDYWRFNWQASYSKGKLFAFTTFEISPKASKIWNRTAINVSVFKAFGIGAFYQIGLGIGPILQWKFVKRMVIWAAFPGFNKVVLCLSHQ